MATVPNKESFYRLSAQGRFGNQVRLWQSVKDLKKSRFQGEVMLRYAGTAGGGRSWGHLASRDVEAAIAKWVSEGLDPARIRIWEMEPLDKVLLHGEVMHSDTGEPKLSAEGEFVLSEKEQPELHRAGWCLNYSTKPIIRMHDALLEYNQHAFGLSALLVLRRFLDEPSLDDLRCLLDDFPDAVVEFTAFSCKLGTCRRNTAIWEVRNY